VRLEWQKCEDPTQTYSALWMNKLLDDQIDNSVYGMKLAKLASTKHCEGSFTIQRGQ